MSAKGSRSKVPNESVQVIVRCRPISQKEKAERNEIVTTIFPSRGVVEIASSENKENRKVFTYDAVYDYQATQKNVYSEVVRPLVGSVLDGFNGCIFAYGQTGTGKTYTMEGTPSSEEQMGVIPRTFEQIWSHIDRTRNSNFLVEVSYLEIYMEELRDLLQPGTKSLELREKEKVGVYVPNLHSVCCKSAEDMLRVMVQGNKNRTVGFTNMNEHSSRSHAIFIIKIEMCDIETNIIKVGKLNLIDLAGSERQSKTGATADRLKEASKINLALSSLGNVISALAEDSPHVPYRDSKLTRLLQDSLGGNSKTIMVANIGPSVLNYNETLTTLRYASRAKKIQNKPIKNEDPQDAKLKEYQEEIQRLKNLLAQRNTIERVPSAMATSRTKKPKKQRSEITVEDIEGDTCEEEEPQFVKEDAKTKEQLEREKKTTAELAAKLGELEGQLIRGGKSILDTYTERQLELEKKLEEISERKRREVEIQQKLELEEETTLEIRETVTSLEQEVDIKTRKLNKCYGKYLALQQEMTDTKFDHNQDLRELEMTQNELVKELKKLLLIIDNFVPLEVKNRLYTQAKYDEEQEEWKLSPTDFKNDAGNSKRPVSNPKNRRPISDFALQKAKKNESSAIRFRNENIMKYELDMPCRTTCEYKSPKISASLQAVLAEAMKTEDDIDIGSTNRQSLRSRLDRIIDANTKRG
ncbi:KIF3C family protein [Megaselia abdita]